MLKTLDKMYDIIFEDERMQELFLNFHSKNWFNLTLDEKKKIIEEINERVASLYGYTPNTIKYEKSGFYGSHSSFKGEITVNCMSLEKDCGYEVVDTYFHELRHDFQSRAVENELTEKEHIDQELKEELEKNMLPGNYLLDSEFYKYQAMERDAWFTGMLFARRVYILNKRKISETDEKWKDYCALHKDVIVDFISDNEESRAKIEDMKLALEEQYDSKIEDKPQYDMGKMIYDVLKHKDFNELSFKDVATLLSPYAFSNLDISEKVKLLSRYRDLVKYGGLKYDIKENTIGSIKLRNRTFPIESSLTMINDLLSFNFKNMVDDIVSGRKQAYPLSKKAINELILNMYKGKDGKKINFVSDSDNLFTFSLQPYAKYESGYVLSEFKKLKQVELEVFGKRHAVWDYWDNFYDNKIIFKTASEVIGMPFEEYYENLLESYRENIMKDVNSTKNIVKR